MYDSGSESNVIDYEYFCQLGRPMTSKIGRMSCANGSPLNIVGYTALRINAGPNEFVSKFTVVEKMFPHVIVGLRTMKKEKISLVPEQDCIFIKGTQLHFLSKTDSVQEN